MYHVSPSAIMTSRNMPRESYIDRSLAMDVAHRLTRMASAVCGLNSLGKLSRCGGWRTSDKQALSPEV